MGPCAGRGDRRGRGGRRRLAGLCSHLATSEERDTTFADEQIARFRALADRFPPCPRHLANSGGALYLEGARFDKARCGIAVYGISPRDEDAAADGLTPVLTWTSEVRLVKALAPGEASGYGRRIRAERPLRVAHVPVGYADGFPRPSAGSAQVVVGGVPCTVGAVAMDQLAVILPSDLRVTVGDEVTLVGRGAPIEELARAAGTIGYEIACAPAPPARPRHSRGGGMSFEELAAAGRALIGEEGWIVGGAVRDHLLGRPVEDWDVVVAGDPGKAARAHARRAGGSPFPLSERHGAWRVTGDGRMVDFTERHGSLADDLARRDFTANAVAVALADGAVTDPHGGVEAIEQRVLRVVGDGVFRDDPLRLLRLPRLAAELEFAVDEATAAVARRDAQLAASAAGERQLAELQRILGVRDPVDALSLCDELGVLAAVLPEVDALTTSSSRRSTTSTSSTTRCTSSTRRPTWPRTSATSSRSRGRRGHRGALAAPLDGTMDVRDGLRWARPAARHREAVHPHRDARRRGQVLRDTTSAASRCRARSSAASTPAARSAS